MESPHHENPIAGNEELKEAFEYYLADLPLTPDDLQKPLLDVGAGEGKFVQYVREVLGNSEAIGVEAQEHKISGKEGLIVSDGLELPFPDESFDVVIAHNYLPMFVAEPAQMEAAIRELIRVAKKGGKVMGDISTPESVTRSDEETKNALGAEYSERDRQLHERRLKGAESLRSFLDTLKQDHEVQSLKPHAHTVIIVRK